MVREPPSPGALYLWGGCADNELAGVRLDQWAWPIPPAHLVCAAICRTPSGPLTPGRSARDDLRTMIPGVSVPPVKGGSAANLWQIFGNQGVTVVPAGYGS
jgi:hypothetical protein